MDMTAGVRLGGAEVQDPEELLEGAVELAKDADVVIAVVGLNADWYEYCQLGCRTRSDAPKGVRRLRSHHA
jgi:beta-glucosidase